MFFFQKLEYHQIIIYLLKFNNGSQLLLGINWILQNFLLFSQLLIYEGQMPNNEEVIWIFCSVSL